MISGVGMGSTWKAPEFIHLAYLVLRRLTVFADFIFTRWGESQAREPCMNERWLFTT